MLTKQRLAIFTAIFMNLPQVKNHNKREFIFKNLAYMAVALFLAFPSQITAQQTEQKVVIATPEPSLVLEPNTISKVNLPITNFELSKLQPITLFIEENGSLIPFCQGFRVGEITGTLSNCLAFNKNVWQSTGNQSPTKIDLVSSKVININGLSLLIRPTKENYLTAIELINDLYESLKVLYSKKNINLIIQNNSQSQRTVLYPVGEIPTVSFEASDKANTVILNSGISLEIKFQDPTPNPKPLSGSLVFLLDKSGNPLPTGVLGRSGNQFFTTIIDFGAFRTVTQELRQNQEEIEQ